MLDRIEQPTRRAADAYQAVGTRFQKNLLLGLANLPAGSDPAQILRDHGPVALAELVTHFFPCPVVHLVTAAALPLISVREQGIVETVPQRGSYVRLPADGLPLVITSGSHD